MIYQNTISDVTIRSASNRTVKDEWLDTVINGDEVTRVTIKYFNAL